MTSNRPYKPASPPDLVAGIMLGHTDSLDAVEEETDKVLHLCFDREILDRFILLLREKIYGPGFLR